MHAWLTDLLLVQDFVTESLPPVNDTVMTMYVHFVDLFSASAGFRCRIVEASPCHGNDNVPDR